MAKTREAVVGLFVLLGLLCVAYLTVKLGRMELGRGDGYTLEARFTSVSGLRVGAAVEIAGVSVGRVTEIRLDPKEAMAIVALQVSRDVKLTDDAIASVKTSGLIGDKYIDIQPGGNGSPLANGDTITDTESAVDIEALISKYVFGKV